MSGVAQRYWTASTLQGRRWLMEKRLEAVEQNDLDQLRQLLAAQSKIKPRELTTALEIAVMKKSDDYAECVELLLKHGATPNATNGSGTPFLHLAADAGIMKVLSLLIKYNCDLNQSREDGACALHRAAWHGNLDSVMLLIGHGAGVNICDAAGRTPLITASQGDRSDCVLALLFAGSDVNILDIYGRSALYWAVHFSNTSVVTQLLKSECTVINEQFRGDRRTPLMMAASNGNDDIVEMLVSMKADLDLQDGQARTALLMAARGGHLNCTRYLVLGGSDVNLYDVELATPLLYMADNADIVELLLGAGADPNVKSKLNITPLWVSSHNTRVDSVRLLLQANADTSEPGGWDNNKVPLQIALYKGCFPVVQMLFIASVAMATDMKWLQMYMKDDNLLSRANDDDDVRKSFDWISDVIDIYRPHEPVSLKAFTRAYIRQHLGCIQLCNKIESLRLPTCLKHYIQLKELDDYMQ